jgi:hypothetical protein
MTALQGLQAAERLAAIRVAAQRIGFVLLVAVGLVALGYWRGRADATPSVTPALENALVARAAAAETVTVRAKVTDTLYRRSAALRDTVRIVDTLTVEVVADGGTVTVTIPAPVIRRLQADSATIEGQRWEIAARLRLSAADSAVIREQAAVIRQLHAERQRCGRTCGIVIGAVATAGAVSLAGRVMR